MLRPYFFASAMRIPLYQIDAFTSSVFKGNPAAVCPLEDWLDDDVMQSIAAENNLSETAFYVHKADEFRLRWFTPTREIDLCGHATLATAHVLFFERGQKGTMVSFNTKSGPLFVNRERDMLALDFPSRKAGKVKAPKGLGISLGAKPDKVLAARDYLCVFKKEEEVRALKPDFVGLARLDRMVIATARGNECDFVSRFFAPGHGVNEDPVTGSSHCTLIPYWAEQLGKPRMFARQLSKRGGELYCELKDDRVKIAGHTVKFLEGSIEL